MEKNYPEAVVPGNINFMHNTAVCLPVFTTAQKNRETVSFHQVQGLGALPHDS